MARKISNSEAARALNMLGVDLSCLSDAERSESSEMITDYFVGCGEDDDSESGK